MQKRVVHGLPAAPNVRLIGKGYQGEDHYGIKDFTASGASNDYHKYPPSAEAFAAGNTQFQRWHSKERPCSFKSSLITSFSCLTRGQTFQMPLFYVFIHSRVVC
jgi:hypothetical protein